MVIETAPRSKQSSAQFANERFDFQMYRHDVLFKTNFMVKFYFTTLTLKPANFFMNVFQMCDHLGIGAVHFLADGALVRLHLQVDLGLVHLDVLCRLEVFSTFPAGERFFAPVNERNVSVKAKMQSKPKSMMFLSRRWKFTSSILKRASLSRNTKYF